MLKTLVVAAGMLAVASAAAAMEPPLKSAAAIKWGPAPPGLPPGSQAAVLSGDPTKTGLFVMRAKLPAGYKVPPHWHPTDETVTVLSGDLTLGMGDKIDPKTAETLTAGGFIVAGAKMHHYATSKDGAVIQIAAEGPFMITYVNPADDPTEK